MYILLFFITTSSVKLFLVNVQFFRKRKNNTHKTFHILKIKAHFEKRLHFENESITMSTIGLLYDVNEMKFMDLELKKAS